MEDIFQKVKHMRSSRRPFDLNHHRPNQTTFGTNSLRSLGPTVWNKLPSHI